MARCEDCVHNNVCKYVNEKVSVGILVFETLHNCKDYLSAADVAEVKHGHWIKRGNEKKCSVCGFIYYSNNDDWNGCPKCGAKMDGGKQDEL